MFVMISNVILNFDFSKLVRQKIAEEVFIASIIPASITSA